MNSTEAIVLLVDDDEIDREMTIRAFRKARIANQIVEATNGLEALEFLRGQNGKTKVKPPYLVLLDINMPKMDGLEFLQEIRSDEKLHDTIVFVLSTSDHDADKYEAYQQNIAGYILKHRVGSDFLNLTNMIDHYWKVVALPDAQRSPSGTNPLTNGLTRQT